MKYVLLIISLFGLSLTASAQLNCGKAIPAEKLSFKGGEQITYTMTYNSSLIKTAIADVTLSIEELTWGQKPALRATATARTRPFYNAFFRLENNYEAILDKAHLRPLLYSSKQREGSYRYNTSYTYNWNSNQVKTTGHNVKHNRTYQQTLPLNCCSYDAMSLFLNMRCMDASNVGPGYKLLLNLVLEDTVRNISFRYVGREIYTVKEVGKFRTLKFEGDLATTKDEGFTDGSKFYIWISDDRNHIPIFMETPIKVGRIQGSIHAWKGLKFPFDALIERYKKP